MLYLNKNKEKSKMYRIVESGIAQVGGWLAVSTGIGTGVLELTSHWRVDDTVQILLSLGGLVFLCFKINNSRIDTKIKKQELKRLKKENKDG